MLKKKLMFLEMYNDDGGKTGAIAVVSIILTILNIE